MDAPTFVAACVQMRSGRDPAKNRSDAIALVEAAAGQGAQYVQTPEMTSLLERDRALLFDLVRTQEEDETLAALRETARRLAIVVHVGSLAIRVGDRIANRSFLIDRTGEIAGTYDKIHLFDVDLPNGETLRESATYTGGEEAVLASTPWGPIGLAICYDLRFPHLYRAYAEAGAVFLCAPSAFTRQTGEAHWSVLQRARAVENGAFMISAAQGGHHESGRETYGHSIIVDPWGRVLAEAGTEPGLIVARIDVAQVERARRQIPSLAHTRPFRLNIAAVEGGAR